MCILSELFDAALKLGGHSILNVSSEVIYEVATVIEGVEMMGFQIDWLDKVIGEIQRGGRHHKQFDRSESVKARLEEKKKQMDDIERACLDGGRDDHRRCEPFLCCKL